MPNSSQDPVERPGLWPRLVKNASWLLGARAANLPLALLETVLLARLLGPEGYGTLAVVMATVVVIHQVFSFRMNEFVVKFLSEALEAGRPDRGAATLKIAFAAEAASSLLAGLLIVSFAPLLSHYLLSAGQPSRYIALFALWPLMNGVTETSSGVLQVLDQFRYLATLNVVRKLLLSIGLGILFFRQGSLEGVLVAYLLANLIANAAIVKTVLALVKDRLGSGWWKTKFDPIRPDWPRMRSFAVSTHVSSTLSIVVRDGDLLWLGFFRTPAEVGYFKLASSLLKAPFAAGSPISKAFYPEIARLAQSHDGTWLRKFLARTTKLSALWIVPLAIATAAVAPWIIARFHGTEFLPALPALWILLSGATVAFVFFWTRPALLALGKPELLLKVTAVSAILKVGLGLVIVPRFGYLGLAVLLVLLQIVGLAAHLVGTARSTRS